MNKKPYTVNKLIEIHTFKQSFGGRRTIPGDAKALSVEQDWDMDLKVYFKYDADSDEVSVVEVLDEQGVKLDRYLFDYFEQDIIDACYDFVENLPSRQDVEANDEPYNE